MNGTMGGPQGMGDELQGGVGGDAPEAGIAAWGVGSGESDPLMAREDELRKGRSVNEGVLILAVVLAATAAMLYFMRKGGAAEHSTATAGAESRIETTLAQLGRLRDQKDWEGQLVAVNSTAELISHFFADPTEKQVPLEHLRKNPFVPTVALARAAMADAEATGLPKPPQQDPTARLRAELQSLELQMVMNGRTPLASVSGDVVKVGDKLGSFLVTGIQPRAVILTAMGKTYQLAMELPGVTKGD